MEIHLASRRRKQETIQKEFSAATIIDVTSKAVGAYREVWSGTVRIVTQATERECQAA